MRRTGVLVLAPALAAGGLRRPGRRPDGGSAQAALRGHAEGARPPGLQLREDRRRARRRRSSATSRSIWRGPERRGRAAAEGDPRVVHHPARGRHRHLHAQRRLPDRHDQPRRGRGHPGRHLGLRRARRSSGWPSTASTTIASGEIMGDEARQAAWRQGQGRDHHQPGRDKPAAAARRRRRAR